MRFFFWQAFEFHIKKLYLRNERVHYIYFCRTFFFCCARIDYFPMQWWYPIQCNDPMQVLSIYMYNAQLQCDYKKILLWENLIHPNRSFYLELTWSGRASTSFEFADKLFIQVSSFFSLLQVGLYFSKLCQVQGSNFFCLFNLLLISLDLLNILELVLYS